MNGQLRLAKWRQIVDMPLKVLELRTYPKLEKKRNFNQIKLIEDHSTHL